ncbi:MAG: hypothetical protein AABX86_00340 [Nanoarchaeota archaeon]
MAFLDRRTIPLSIAFFTIGLIAILSPEYRDTIILLIVAILAIFYVSSLYRDVEDQQLEIVKLNENIKIYEHIADLRACSVHLEKRSRK